MTAPAPRAAMLAARLIRPVLLATVVATAAGCVVVSRSDSGGPGRAGDTASMLSPRGEVPGPRDVRIGVSAAGTPVVLQEPVVVPASLKDADRIVWRLPPDSGLTFPDNGIVIEGEVTQPTEAEWRRFAAGGKPAEYRVVIDKAQKVITGCRRVTPVEFACDNARRPGRFAYTLRLLRDGKPLEPLDPTVVNLP